jgi:hypothetical protein
LCALAEDGRFLTDLQPTRDYTVAAAFWRQNPTAQPASLCGRDQNLVACSFSDVGWEWLKESAVESPGIPPEHDLASDLGVPGSDADDGRRPPYVRDPGGWMAMPFS